LMLGQADRKARDQFPHSRVQGALGVYTRKQLHAVRAYSLSLPDDRGQTYR
jgi:hypothetical protein